MIFWMPQKIKYLTLLQSVEEPEKEGRLRHGGTIVEGVLDSTGIKLSLMAVSGLGVPKKHFFRRNHPHLLHHPLECTVLALFCENYNT